MSLPATLLTLLSVSLATSAFAQTARPCQITGNIKGLGNKSVVFFYEHNGHQQHDTVYARNNSFTYVAHPSDDGTVNLKIVPSRYTSIWYEPGRITVTGDVAVPGQLAVTGTPENDIRAQYNQRINWKFERRAEAHSDSVATLRPLIGQATRDFIESHPHARTSADLLYEQVQYSNDQPLAKYEQLWHALAPVVQTSTQGQAVATRLEVLRKQPVVGRPVPTFVIPDTAGVAVSLEKFKGQYVLLDFWGHWCKPCIAAMPHLKQMQKRYAQQMAVVGIGMEAIESKELWLKAIREHQALWTQLSELKKDKGVIEQYNIDQFPTYMLLDKQGVLLVKSSDLASIEEKLKTLLATP
ncbi:TlpA disulfide reductase family protein [Hymenobacter sp.]|jgi:thiol-disulfide isomerase/thioredoxin|uniref:TlpA disulfide reductase family protein n=1 Tax=Hymenobacter sp. TaxID=1898978 RepID=UPI002EDA3A5B